MDEQNNPRLIIDERKKIITNQMLGKDKPCVIGPQLGEITTFLMNIEGTLYEGKGHEVDPTLQKEFYEVFHILNSVSPSTTYSLSQDSSMGLPPGVYSYHLVTGRPEAYVEGFCLSHHMRKYGPHVVERGAILCTFGEPAKWDRRKYLVDLNIIWANDLLNKLQSGLGQQQNIDIKELVEPGKVATLTLNTPSGMTPDQFAGTLDTVLKEYIQSDESSKGPKLKWVYTQSGVDIFPETISKFSGVEALLNITGRTWDQCVFFGDSMDDVPIFEKVGVSCVSYSAHSDLAVRSVMAKDVAKRIITEMPHGWGTLGGLYRVIEHNLAIRQETAKKRPEQVYFT